MGKLLEAEEKRYVAKIKEVKTELFNEIKKVIVGQEDVIEKLLFCLFAKGHCLIIGVPGLAKTMLIKTLAEILDLKFNRIQFTPDLMPSDIIGTDIITETKSHQREFKFIEGPVFANIVLADEINRTPPKTQSALLQAMQEKKVTVSGKTYELELPFFVLATQNPIEQEGTYPLPEAQLDRFMFSINITYPKKDEENKIVKLTTSDYSPKVKKLLNRQEILKLQDIVYRVPVSDFCINYAVTFVSMTRPKQKDTKKYINDFVSWGAGPRASQYLILGAKARAIMDGRFTVSREDINFVAESVLSHRIITNFTAEAEGITSTDIVKKLIKEMESFKP